MSISNNLLDVIQTQSAILLMITWTGSKGWQQIRDHRMPWYSGKKRSGVFDYDGLLNSFIIFKHLYLMVSSFNMKKYNASRLTRQHEYFQETKLDNNSVILYFCIKTITVGTVLHLSRNKLISLGVSMWQFNIMRWWWTH
jgi:hypothetical protein